jgi:hypothetical protein
MEYEFCARKNGTMKLFKTEKEAYEYADPDSSVAKYATEDGTNFSFVGVVGLKTSAENIEKLLQG